MRRTMQQTVDLANQGCDHSYAARRLHIAVMQSIGCMMCMMAAMDEVLKALADPSRCLLLDNLNARDGQSLRELCEGLPIARQSVSKHWRYSRRPTC